MLESNKLIEFSIHSDLKNIEIIKPFQTKHFLPNWFKKIDAHSVEEMNIKGCVPFTDCLSAGYILPLPQDLFVAHRTYNLEKSNHNTLRLESYLQLIIHAIQIVTTLVK